MDDKDAKILGLMALKSSSLLTSSLNNHPGIDISIFPAVPGGDQGKEHRCGGKRGVESVTRKTTLAGAP